MGMESSSKLNLLNFLTDKTRILKTKTYIEIATKIPTMKKALLLMGLLCGLLLSMNGQSLPPITSATYTVSPPKGGSPNGSVTVRAHVPELGGIGKIYLTISSGGQEHVQEYEPDHVASPRPGGYALLLKCFVPNGTLAGATVTVRLADSSSTKGSPFAATQE